MFITCLSIIIAHSGTIHRHMANLTMMGMDITFTMPRMGTTSILFTLKSKVVAHGIGGYSKYCSVALVTAVKMKKLTLLSKLSKKK